MLLDDSADSDELEVQAVLNNMANTVKYMYSFTVKYLFLTLTLSLPRYLYLSVSIASQY